MIRVFGSGAGVPEAIIAKVSPGARVIGFETAGAIGVVVCSASLTPRNSAADNRTGGEPADHRARAIVTTPPAIMMPSVVMPAMMPPAVMSITNRLRRRG
jgi:hypothetical protein